MKVILLKDVENIGRAGDIKEVKDGFAGNFLIPRALATAASPAALRALEERQKISAAEGEEKRRQLEEYAAKISALEMRTALKIGEKEEVFGSINPIDIRNFLAGEGIQIDKSQIQLEEPLKTLGSHDIDIRLMPGLEAKLKVFIEAGK